ncbi:MAG: CooT family nickel-binding protein [Candidatus Bathyarchaeota archaeon]|nr:MAG: CooT family nickel-binding protein [Candidatus Bathyarchaeota archaeon]
MCEFTVFLGKEAVCKDIVYAKVEAGKVFVKDVLGVSEVFENCQIVEVDVTSERLVIASTKQNQ